MLATSNPALVDGDVASLDLPLRPQHEHAAMHPIGPDVPEARPSLAQVAHLIGGMLLRSAVRFAFRIRVDKPRDFHLGPAVIAANHRSFSDPPLVAMWFHLPVSFFARANLWRLPVIGLALRTFGGLPVDRAAPQIETMKRTVQWLRDGKRILIFPEGTRTKTGQLGRLRAGPALFARRARVPVIPVYLYGSEHVWPRGCPVPTFWSRGGRVVIRYGSPIHAPAHLPAKLQDRFITLALERWLGRQEARFQGLPG